MANIAKKWYKSKTFWVNLIAAIGIILQIQFGWVVTPETASIILVVINFILRLITGKPIEW